MNFMQKLKPGLPKPWLHITAALMWSGVGVFLNTLAYEWLHPVPVGQTFMLAVLGAVLAWIIYQFGFSKLAKENIHRIEAIEAEKPCWFAFQKWTSYPLIAFMIALGIFLREHTPIPKPYLAVLYIGIGGGLFLSSLLYYGHLWKKWSE